MGIFDSFRKKRPEESSGKVRRQTPRRGKEAGSGRWQVGDRLQNRYEIHHILGGPGKSGMGIVYICYDHEFKTPVAVKTFQDRFLQDQDSIDRFKWEAETWVRLERHHNIVRAGWIHEIEGRPYIFLEYIVGDKQYGADLSGWIWGGGLTLPLTLNFAVQSCHGMMHAQGKFEEMGRPFVHRDVKPSNIMVTHDRVVKVTDFGLVKAFAESDLDIRPVTSEGESHPRPSLSKSGAICGTPPYMSPEQCRGEKDLDTRTDIYAFGCVLYEMLTGRPVFEARTPEEYIHHHLKATPRSPNTHRELDKVVLKCLEKERGRRYESFAELEVELSRIYLSLTGEAIKAPQAEALKASELSNKGVSLANLGLHQEAISCYQQALRINPNDAEAHYNLGMTYKAQGILDLAVSEYREALRINHNYAGAHNNLGIAYSAQGKHDLAVSEYREALRIDPNLAEAHINLGTIYQAQAETDLAVTELREALRIDPNLAEAHYNLGTVYQIQGKTDLAVAELREALRINPNHVGAHNNLAAAYSAQGKLDLAVSEYGEAIRISPNSAEAHINLGTAYHAQGKLREALAHYEAFVRLAPPHLAAYVGQVEEAIRQLRQNM